MKTNSNTNISTKIIPQVLYSRRKNGVVECAGEAECVDACRRSGGLHLIAFLRVKRRPWFGVWES